MTLPYIGPEEPQRIEVPTSLFLPPKWIAMYAYLTLLKTGGITKEPFFPFLGAQEPPMDVGFRALGDDGPFLGVKP